LISLVVVPFLQKEKKRGGMGVKKEKTCGLMSFSLSPTTTEEKEKGERGDKGRQRRPFLKKKEKERGKQHSVPNCC